MASDGHTSDSHAKPAPEPASGITQPQATERAAEVEGKAELDEFGLPVRPKRPRGSFHENGSDSEEREDDETSSQRPTGQQVSSPKLQGKLKEESIAPRSSSPPPMSPRIETQAGEQVINGRTEEVDPDQPGAEDILSSPLRDKADEYAAMEEAKRQNTKSLDSTSPQESSKPAISEYSHQNIVTKTEEKPESELDDEWQEMPAYAPFNIYNDDNKLIAREAVESDEEDAAYGGLGGAGKGYTRVTLDDDADSVTSMEDHTAYLFKEKGTGVVDEDEDSRDAVTQMQATKDLLTEVQRFAYVGLTRLALLQMQTEQDKIERTKTTRKLINISVESMKMWGQKMMVRLYGHMGLESAEQIMIEQLGEHGVQPADMSPSLMRNARVKNPAVLDRNASSRVSTTSSRPSTSSQPPSFEVEATLPQTFPTTPDPTESPPPYDAVNQNLQDKKVKTFNELPQTQNIDIDIRWTVLCDLFLILIADSNYDARSRQLLEKVGSFLDVTWIDLCRFERRVTDALEMQEAANEQNWNEQEHIESRSKSQRKQRLLLMGVATVGGGLVIGLSAGLLAPLIGAGLAAGFTTIGVAGTSSFLAGAGGAAIITSTGLITGSTIGVRAAQKRGGAVQTFEYRPLHNNKRTNLIVTVSGWMTGKVDDVRLPFSTVDPVMGDIYSIHWEPEMLRSMGDTINILANEALTQTIQQVLGATILTTLMAAIQLPVVLTKLSYLIDNPWSNSLARAHLAGLIFADSLIERNLGTRPVTLVGFSLGAKVIFSCLQELVAKGAYGLVQNVYLFGSPIIASRDEYTKAKSVIAGRFVNGYATNDWILGYLFRATGGGISKVAGLSAVESIEGIENIDVTEDVPGHMSYRAAMPKLLRKVGWSVESDEFTEIEDPDPDNHEKRQRELINEIEEARRNLETGKKSKWRFGMFRTKKDRIEKKSWETYDDRVKMEPSNNKGKENDSGVLFDVDAIRAEAAELAARAELAAEGFDVRELESTLPPMKLDLSRANSVSTNASAPLGTAPASDLGPLVLKSNKSYNDSVKPSDASDRLNPLAKHQTHSPRQSYDDWDHYDRTHERHEEDGNISMTFDDTPAERSSYAPPRLSFEPSPRPSHDAYKGSVAAEGWKPPAESVSASSHKTERPNPEPVVHQEPTASFEHNAWVDDDKDDYGQEKEMKMTFE